MLNSIQTTRKSKSNIPVTVDTAHPGVGVPTYEDGETLHHKYYQWVAFLLFLQALMFYFPRLLWLYWEDKRLEKVLPTNLFFEVDDKRMGKFTKPLGVVKDNDLQTDMDAINDFITDHIRKTRFNNLVLFFIL